jgi:hypothetical protein
LNWVSSDAEHLIGLHIGRLIISGPNCRHDRHSDPRSARHRAIPVSPCSPLTSMALLP